MPISKAGMPAGAERLFRTRSTSSSFGGAGGAALRSKLHKEFQEFWSSPVVEDEVLRERALECYSLRILQHLSAEIAELRFGDGVPKVRRLEHDALCFSQALWELVHHVLVCRQGFVAPDILSWYIKHYLEDWLVKWRNAARRSLAMESDAFGSQEFWPRLQCLALSDQLREVLELLHLAQRQASLPPLVDRHLRDFCDCLAASGCLSELKGSRVLESRRATVRGLLNTLPEWPHAKPYERLLEIYAGVRPRKPYKRWVEDFEDAQGSWLEDFVYTLNWAGQGPRTPRHDLGCLLREVSDARDQSEPIDDIDRIFFAVFTQDIPGVLAMLGDLPEKFPQFVCVHLVDLLYSCGHIPAHSSVSELSERDNALMCYASSLMNEGDREMQRHALDYLRAGDPCGMRESLEIATERYVREVPDGEDIDVCISLLGDLGLDQLGNQFCRWQGKLFISRGDVKEGLRILSRAENFHAGSAFISEVIDDILANDADSVAIGARNFESVPVELTCVSDYANCQTFRQENPSQYFTKLVQVLSSGAAPPQLVQRILHSDILPLLRGNNEMRSDDILLLMQCVDDFEANMDHPQGRELHEAMVQSLSIACLCQPLIPV